MKFEQEKKSNLKRIVFLNRYYKIIIVVIVVVIGIGGYYFVGNKKVTLAQEQKLNMEAKLNASRDAQKYLAELNKLEKTIMDFQKTNAEQIAKVAQVLPVKPQIPELLAQTEALILSSNFKIESLDIAEQAEAIKKPKKAVLPEQVAAGDSEAPVGQIPSDATSVQNGLPETIKTIAINLAVSGGDYFAFKNLVNNLEKHVRLFDLTSFSFGVGKNGGGEYSLNLQTYYYQP